MTVSYVLCAECYAVFTTAAGWERVGMGHMRCDFSCTCSSNEGGSPLVVEVKVDCCQSYRYVFDVVVKRQRWQQLCVCTKH